MSGKSDPIVRLGIIGLGGATVQMLPSLLSHPCVELTACADPRAEARERFSQEFDARAFRQAEDLCRSLEVDAVYIASPHQFHKDHAVMAAENGKHLIIEKPMALSLADCDVMIGAAERNGVHIVVGHTHSFDPPIVRMREIICSGELGALAMINSWSYGNFLYRPRRPEELKTEAGGGIIYNQVPHQVDVVRYLGGGLVESVRSMVWALDPARPTEGSHITFLQFENGCAASVVFSGYDFFDSDEFHFWISESGEERQPGGHGKARAMLSRLTHPSEEVALQAAKAYGTSVERARSIGEHHHPHCGVTIASCEHGDLRPSADGVLIYDHNGRREVPIPVGRAFPDKTGVIDELYDAIVGVRLPIHDGRWGKATMEVAAAILQSSRERREIQMRYQVQLKKD